MLDEKIDGVGLEKVLLPVGEIAIMVVRVGYEKIAGSMDAVSTAR